ncbi:MAG: DUF4422 domain-containing protein [Bifidobacterium pseudocatenulatum]
MTTPFGNLDKDHRQAWHSIAHLWEAAPLLHDDDLKRCYRILCKHVSGLQGGCQMFFNGNKACFCNMFIMKKEIFFDYC